MKKLVRSGEPFVWLTGLALACSLTMVGALVVLIGWNALGFFWAEPVFEFRLDDGRRIVGEVTEREAVPGPEGAGKRGHRVQVKQGNRDLTGTDFLWLDEEKVASRRTPREIVALERREWGAFYGIPSEFRAGGKVLARGAQESFLKLKERLPAVQKKVDQLRDIETDDVGRINREQERLRLAAKRDARRARAASPDAAREGGALETEYATLQERIREIRNSLDEEVVFQTASGQEKAIAVSQIVRAYRPNAMSVLDKVGLYLSRGWELLNAPPRESNTEGGLLPAIFGTVMMVLIMSVLVTPLGVLAALYLREYAKQGPLVSAVRIAVNNLAGVPSIVFGVFGVGFFIYFAGGTIDRVFFPEALPTPTFGTGGILWASLTLALLTVPVVIVATEEGLAAIPGSIREASLALGATKFETTWRVVLPAVMPSILTGLILAMARAAGEVAPLMITGVVKLAPTLPIDGQFPFFHPDRKFMHLGFHIYDVGFQSPNVDAARPMVYMTTLVLLNAILILNLAAIALRNRLRQRLAHSAV